MIINQDNALLMIEPTTGEEPPVDDELTAMAFSVWERCRPKFKCYKGVHTCVCGQRSDNDDHETPSGRLTNSLMLHYVRRHRSIVPESEILKLRQEFKK